MSPDQIRKLFHRPRIIVGAIAAIILAFLYLGVSWYVVDQALKGEVLALEQYPDEFGLTYKDVAFHPRGDDSITLRGWWLPADEPIGSIIWVHGVDNNRATELPMLHDLINEGFSVLAFDLRGHGESDAVPLGAGYKEPADVRGAMDFLLDEKLGTPNEVLLMGWSFGAGIALMAAAGEPSVVAVYADSPFASLTDVMINEITLRTPVPGWLASTLRPGIVQMANLRGIKVDEVQPEVAVTGYTDLVIGLAHCRGDERIPVEHSLRIRAAAAKTGAWFNLYPRCGHNDAYDNFTEQYVSIVTNYFREQLGLPAAQP